MNATEISKLQIGDAVGVTNRYGSGASKLTVTNRTATQLTLSDNSRWTLRGKEIGKENFSSYHRFLITAADADKRAEYIRVEAERNALIAKLNAFNWKALSVEQLKSVLQSIGAA